MLRRAAALSTSTERPRYLEPLSPIIFPEEAQWPETQLHLDLRTLLYHILSDYLGLEVTVGPEQFVYFDSADPKQFLAPDVFVRFESRGARIRSWKTWERGAPEVAVEIISESDASESMGMLEPDAAETKRLRIWDRIEGALIERSISAESGATHSLGHSRGRRGTQCSAHRR